MTKLTHDKKVERFARIICTVVGVPPADPIDGSSNWWMFFNDAEKIIADLESRGFAIWDWIELAEKDDHT